MVEERLDCAISSLLRSIAGHPDIDGPAMTRLGRALEVVSHLPKPPKDCRVSVRVYQNIDVQGCCGTIIHAIEVGSGYVTCVEHGSYTIKEEFRSESEKNVIGRFSYSDSFSGLDAKNALSWLHQVESLVQGRSCRVKVSST